MSRCFPYPPPGYVKNCASGIALIDSIKIDWDKEKIKHEKREQKRRDKEERKKIKKVKKLEKEKLKSIQSINGADKRKRDSDGFGKSLDKSWVHTDEVYLQKKIELEAEQLERSSLTEEHGYPVSLESPSCSSDDTQSKTKKAKIEQPTSRGSCTTQGKVIRFKLKRREHENARPTVDIPSTSSGRTATPGTKTFESPLFKELPRGVASVPIPNIITKESILRPVGQLSLNATSAAQASNDLPTCSSLIDKSQKPKSPYEALFSEWVPPPIDFMAVEGRGEEQWLFSCKKQAAQSKTTSKACDGKSGKQTSLLQPRAHLLPELDLHVLPFTVPF